MKDKTEIALLIMDVAKQCGYERSTVCATDVIMQWENGELIDTMKAWRDYLSDVKNNNGTTSTMRHGAWVPAIPM